MLVNGDKPTGLPANRPITKREWERYHREYTNPVKVGSKFIQYLKDHPGATYDDVAGISGISKARVCPMLALCKRLPKEITDFLMNTDEPETLKHFTERKLRPLTLMASDDDKIERFKEMRQIMGIE